MYPNFEETLYMYDTSHGYDYDHFMNTELMINNRLLCTFTTLETLDELIYQKTPFWFTARKNTMCYTQSIH